MILFFGPPGAGKSMQGQLISVRHGWRWLSAGQLLRDAHDARALQQMHEGRLVDPEIVNGIMGRAIKRAKDLDHVILDGYPRQLSQAKWLIASQADHERAIALVIVLNVPKSELLERLKVRGRVDDTSQAIEERLYHYQEEIRPILEYLAEQKVPIIHVDGIGTVGQVHDRIEAELKACSLV